MLRVTAIETLGVVKLQNGMGVSTVQPKTCTEMADETDAKAQTAVAQLMQQGRSWERPRQ